MNQFLPSRLDGFLREHPALMFLCTIALWAVAALLLISETAREVVVYQAF